jgi:pimeloyl-ACP methyl ester carboxylesterase
LEYLDVEGQRIECQWFNSDVIEGPTLVFLHHGLGCVTTWRDFPEKICKSAGLRGFVYSRTGYGGSVGVELPRPVNYLNDEAENVLPKVLAAAGITDYVLLGHSDGGSMAMIHAGTPGAMTGPRARAIIVIAGHLFVEQSNLDAIAAMKPVYENTDLRQKLQKHHGDNVDTAFYGWSGNWLHADFPAWQIFDLVPGISCPILAIRGKRDEYGSPAQIEKLRQLATADLQVLEPDCGHFPHQEAFQDVHDDILAFLTGHGLMTGSAKSPV